MAMPPHSRTTVAAQRPIGMPDRAVGTGKGMGRFAGDGALLDEQLAHRHHFPFNLLTLDAEIVVSAG